MDKVWEAILTYNIITHPKTLIGPSLQLVTAGDINPLEVISVATRLEKRVYDDR